jgi:hypothetical protein
MWKTCSMKCSFRFDFLTVLQSLPNVRERVESAAFFWRLTEPMIQRDMATMITILRTERSSLPRRARATIGIVCGTFRLSCRCPTWCQRQESEEA